MLKLDRVSKIHINAIKNILKKNKNFINIEKNLIDKIWKNKKKKIVINEPTNHLISFRSIHLFL